jgi:hypothetical protein
MFCQAVCLKNKKFSQVVKETAQFNEEETKMLLNSSLCEQIPSPMMKKLKLLSLTDYVDVLPRNLYVLLK